MPEQTAPQLALPQLKASQPKDPEPAATGRTVPGPTPKETQADQRELRDEKYVGHPVVASDLIWAGKVFDFRNDLVDFPGSAEPLARQYIDHPGAVGILAMRGPTEAPEVLLVRQYRHPVRAYLWEIPAGLLDHAGEDYLAAAQRELAEEADLAAARWNVLVDLFTSPGCTSESLRVFLARDLSASDIGYMREEEEAEMEVRWVGLDHAVRLVLSGALHNPPALAGVLALAAALPRGLESLRGPDAPWLR